jgi:signal transduction histidine kinase
MVAGLVGVLLAGAIGLLVGRRAVRPLGDALALQRRFVADASHELRTPLAVLHTRAQMVRRHLPATTTPEQRTEVDQLVSDTAALGEVVADLLLAAQLEHTDVPASEVDLAEVARNVVESMRPYAEDAGVRLEVAGPDAGTGPRPDAGADAGAADAVVHGAPTALRRALTALVDNAIAHSERGGVVTVLVHSEPDDGDAGATRGPVRVTVQDEGEGLDPSDAASLTTRFARGRSTSAGGGRRFGLGLALVDEVVRAHRGRLEIAGTPGVGSSFTMYLPRQGPPAGG